MFQRKSTCGRKGAEGETPGRTMHRILAGAGGARKNVSDVEAQPRGDGQEKKGTVEVFWDGETVFITCELEPLKGVELGTGPTF